MSTFIQLTLPLSCSPMTLKKTSTALFAITLKINFTRLNFRQICYINNSIKGKSCEIFSLWWGKLCEKHWGQVEKTRFSMKSLSVFIFPHVFPLKTFSSAREEWKLSLKLLFLNKCVSHIKWVKKSFQEKNAAGKQFSSFLCHIGKASAQQVS